MVQYMIPYMLPYIQTYEERTLTSGVNKLSPPLISGENVLDHKLDRTFSPGL